MKVLITGTSRGLGAAIACRMARCGHTVFGISRSGDRPPGWESSFNGRFWEGNASSKELISGIALELRKADDVPDIFIFNAASMEEDLVDGRFDARISENVFKINYLGPLFWIEEFLPDFLERRSGIFAAVSSLVALRPLSKGLHNVGYAASKAALSSTFDFFRLWHLYSGVKFLTFHFGRMGRPVRGVPCVSYEKAADFFCRKLNRPGNKTVFDYPYLSAAIYRFSRIVPDRVWARLLRKADR